MTGAQKLILVSLLCPNIDLVEVRQEQEAAFITVAVRRILIDKPLRLRYVLSKVGRSRQEPNAVLQPDDAETSPQQFEAYPTPL